MQVLFPDPVKALPFVAIQRECAFALRDLIKAEFDCLPFFSCHRILTAGSFVSDHGNLCQRRRLCCGKLRFQRSKLCLIIDKLVIIRHESAIFR